LNELQAGNIFHEWTEVRDLGSPLFTQLRKSQAEQSLAEILLPHPPVVKHCRRYLIYEGAVHFSEKLDLRQSDIEEHNSNLKAKQVACGESQWK